MGEARLARWAFWLMVPLAFLLTSAESRLLVLFAAFGVHHALAETYFGPVLAGLSLVVEVGFTALVGHHVMLFMLMPLFFPRLQKRSEGRRRFGLQSAWVHGAGLTLSLGALGWSVWWDDFFVWNLAILCFIWSTWVHVLWSFFIAGANPSWIRRLART